MSGHEEYAPTFTKSLNFIIYLGMLVNQSKTT